MAKLPSTNDVEIATAVFKPYFDAVGRVVHTWNNLQEQLAVLFCRVTGMSNEIGIAVWHSTNNDRAQREMLRAAVTATDEEWSERYPKAKKDIGWLLAEADKLAMRRNNVVHAPCYVGLRSKSELEIVPLAMSGNPRAKALHGKDILTEFAWYEETAEKLRGFARWTDAALSLENFEWPVKPSMPVLKKK